MTEPIDLELVDKIFNCIPGWTWSVVRDRFIETFVDNMTSDILERLTGSPDNFDRAEEILLNHYVMPGTKQELLLDAIKILGMEQVVNTLDRLELNTIQQPTNSAPCSVDPA